ncbi:GGDEF domain-containing protein, partial [Burkholderia territorii]|uniref:GGDEF domain-containing protein n=1 Tax=Burkholderia territorii TaxID=1503055 RepID=UPI001FC8207C
MLTGLLNRAGLFNAANGNARARIHAGMTLLYLDLDGFKPVNDAHGHETGDTLLVQVAERLMRLAGPEALVARIGGDEFVIVDTCRDYDTPRDFAHAIAREIARPFELAPGITASVGASVGIASVSGEDIDIDSLLRIADAAMYDAKRNKKGDAPEGAQTIGRAVPSSTLPIRNGGDDAHAMLLAVLQLSLHHHRPPGHLHPGGRA